MKHEHGIGVRLKHASGSTIAEYPNPHVSRDPSFKGGLQSLLTLEKPGTDFEIRIDFDEKFKLYSASGVMVAVACGHGEQASGGFEHVQALWLDLPHLRGQRSFIYTICACTAWETDLSVPAEWKLEMPEPDGKSS